MTGSINPVIVCQQYFGVVHTFCAGLSKMNLALAGALDVPPPHTLVMMLTVGPVAAPTLVVVRSISYHDAGLRLPGHHSWREPLASVLGCAFRSRSARLPWCREHTYHQCVSIQHRWVLV